MARHTLITSLLVAAGLAIALPRLLPASQARAQPTSPRAAPKDMPKDMKETLPIKRITLYRSGVGAFERRGLVDANADVQLRFNTDQINDILKSMFVLDKAGQVESIRYGSKDPLSKRLASFGIDISGNPSVRDLLNQLRGAAVKVTTPDGQVSGTILGTESRLESAGKDEKPIEVPYLTLVTQTGIRAVNLRSVTNVVFEDESLNAELTKALGALAEHRADRVKTVDVTFRGQDARDVIIGYIHEMPTWKTSYRLILGEAPKGGSAGKSDGTMQGWAIVENTTDEDWSNVSLGLVSGRPVSFQMDLYEPLYVFRPQVPVPTVPGVAPRTYEGGLVALGKADLEVRANRELLQEKAQQPAPAKRARVEMQERAAGGGGGQSPFRDANAPGEPPVSADDLAQYAARSQAQGVEAGEVFQYQLENPVTIERQKSAMLPILSSPVGARRISIYNRNDAAKNPMRGVELINSTSLQLIPGPISVYDGAAYAGDAQIGHVGAGDKRLLAYAVDLETEVITEQNEVSDLRKIRIVRGVFEQTFLRQSKVKYSIANKDKQRARTLIVEHPRMANWDLVEPKEPSEKTESIYRFEVEVPSAKQGTLQVVQQHTDLHSVGITDLDFNWLLEQAKAGKVSQKVIDAVREAAKKRGTITDIQKRIQRLEAERAEIDKDQNRIRENMRTVGQQAQIYAKYLQKFTEQETRIEAIDAENKAARAEQAAAEADLNEYLRTLNVE